MQATPLPKFFDAATDVELLGGCVGCNGRRFRPVSQEQGLTVERCEGCGLVRTSPRLKQSAILRFYEAGAGLVREGRKPTQELLGLENKNGGRRFPSRDIGLRFQALAGALRRKFSSKKPPLLEIGAGDGHFLRKLQDSGFDVHGFDISQTGVERLKNQGFKATYADSILDAQFPAASFDAVVTWEVFEHIPDPVAFAEEVRRILKPGGFWLIQVPNWRWNSLKLWLTSHVPGKKDYLCVYGVLLPIFHLYHYTHESLRSIVEPQGFKHVQSFRPRLFQETNWTQLLGHELIYWADTVPALLSCNRRHRNVMLVELFRAQA